MHRNIAYYIRIARFNEQYLQGIQENRTTGQQKKGVTLREVYHQFYQDGTLPWIPSVWVNGDLLEVDYGSAE